MFDLISISITCEILEENEYTCYKYERRNLIHNRKIISKVKDLAFDCMGRLFYYYNLFHKHFSNIIDYFLLNFCNSFKDAVLVTPRSF